MTLSAEAAAPGVDRDVVEQQFTEIYSEHWDRLRKHVYFRLPPTHVDLAEDLAQEAFITLLQHMLKGRPVTKPFGLLRVMANQLEATYFGVKANTGHTSVDFGNPATSPITAGHRYAAAEPGLASLTSELDAALEEMRSASKKWRGLHTDIYSYQQSLAGGWGGAKTLTPARKAQRQEELAAAVAAEVEALNTFRQTCRRVGALRAELEAAAPNWQSSTGMPPSTASSGVQAGSVRSDLSVTECPEGHSLDRNNVHFLEDGTRRCRACAAAAKARATKKSGKSDARGRGTIGPELFETAKQMLLDPASDMTIPDVARALGVSPTTLYRNIPGLSALRRSAHEAYLQQAEQLALVPA
jgi:DNA-directed RNA polymerase specialized sigma24 family protein